MRRSWVSSGLLSVLLLAMCVEAGEAESDHDGVIVFSARHLPSMTGVMQAGHIYYLDGADAALAPLRFANPRNPTRAAAQASVMLQTPEGLAAIEQITEVGKGIALAWQHGITKLPAVMVDGTHVVYGVFDVDEAVQIIKKAPSYEI